MPSNTGSADAGRSSAVGVVVPVRTGSTVGVAVPVDMGSAMGVGPLPQDTNSKPPSRAARMVKACLVCMVLLMEGAGLILAPVLSINHTRIRRRGGVAPAPVWFSFALFASFAEAPDVL